MGRVSELEAFLHGHKPEPVALFRRFQELVEACGPSELVVRKSIVYWRRSRIFAGAWPEGSRLELNVDLLREAEHPAKLVAFHHTKRVLTHRLRIERPEQLDAALADLLAESYAEVGPGTRKRVHESHI
jgi:hypothetical protein